MSTASSFGRLIAAHWALWAVLAFFLLAGALTLDDYGAWVDDPSQRKIGNATLDYLAGGHLGLAFPTRYYGAVAEAPLVLVERLIGAEDEWDVLLGRRALLHLFFLGGGGAACYLLIHRVFGSRPLALVAMVLFLLHPRIYAHSFYNSKDIPFLAMFLIALYLAHRAFRRDALGAFLLCGVGVGLLVNLRVMGIVLFAAVLALRALDLALAGNATERRRALLTGGAFALAAVLTYYASLPVLWTDPFGRFADLLSGLSNYPRMDYNLFRNQWLYAPDGPPFDYVPTWVGITTPPATLLLASAGAVALAWRGLRRPRDILRNGPLRFGILLAALPVATTVAIVVFESNLYDWRHLSFLYAPLFLLAAFGLHGIMALARGPWPRAGTYALAGAAIAVALVSVVRIHPYQPNYFNVLVDRTTPEGLKFRYQMSIWGQSLLSTLGDIAREYPSGPLFLSPAYVSTEEDSRVRPPDIRERITVTRDFRSGERNLLELDPGQPYPVSGPAIAYVARLYAVTLHCLVDPVVWFGGLRREALATEPLVRSTYDVWRDRRQLTYVRDGCPLADIEAGGPRFFLHVVPLAEDLPGWRGRNDSGFHNLDYVLRGGRARIDGNCVASVVLPDYPIARIRTGQITDEGVLWEVDIAFGEAAPDYAAARREALAGEPVARSVYDVHLDGRELTYLRDGCAEAEAEARFFLHVVPTDDGDLPPHREQYGFDNLDFTLAARGARIDGDCVAVARLPGYPIATVRTGQYDGTGARWAVEFALPDAE